MFHSYPISRAMELLVVLIKKVSIIQMARFARNVHSGKDETGGPVKEYINIALHYLNLLFTKSVDNPVFNLSYSTPTHCQPWSLVKLAKNWSNSIYTLAWGWRSGMFLVCMGGE